MNNNYDDILLEATTYKQDSGNNNNTAVIDQLIQLQNLLKTSINLKEFEEQKNYVEYLVSIVKKTVKQEDSLIRQILYTGFSAYSKDPVNLGIMAPTSEGKTHAAIETLQYFPKEDVWNIGSMSPKVIIRQNGILVDSNNEPIEEKIKDLKSKITKEKEENVKEKIKEELSEILKDAKILINLDHKIFLFLEPPHSETWDILKPILSHDLYEIEHPYVFNIEGYGFKVKNIVTRGWPSCIFCSAKHESNWPTWPEVQSRFLITSPNMIKLKYEESNLLIAQSKGLPKSIQQKIIISDKDKEITKTCVLYIKEKIKNNAILLLSSSSTTTAKEHYQFESVSVWIPYAELLASALPSDKGTDVRVAKRIFSFLELLPLIKSESRFKILYGPELLVVASIEDLAEVLYLTQDLNGIPPYKMQFFKNVFIPLFKSEDKPHEKDEKVEERIAVNSKELSEFYKLKEGKTMTDSNIRKNYLAEFLQNGLIDEANSLIDGRYKIYYPLVEIPSTIVEEENKEGKYEKYRNLSHSRNLFQYCRLMSSKNYINIDKKWLNFAILKLLKYGNDVYNFQFFILDYDGNNDENEKICICQFEKKYEESKYGPLILLFSNAKNCNSYNKIFGEIKYIGVFSDKNKEKLEEWPKFSQYSYFNVKSEEEEEQELDNNYTQSIEKTYTNSGNYPSFKNKRDQIDNFFASDNGQESEHTLEESICKPLIGQQRNKPFFYYCKEDPKVENINLKSIEDHIRLKDPEKHRAKLLE